MKFSYIGRETNAPGVPDTHYTFSQHVSCTGCGLQTGRARRVCSANMQTALYHAHLQAREMWNKRAGIEHDDDKAVYDFAEVMCDKMASSRAKGRTGWSNPELCSADVLCQQFIGHIEKGNEGNFIDLATFAMMLHTRGDDPKQLAEMFNTMVEQKARQLIMEEACQSA